MTCWSALVAAASLAGAGPTVRLQESGQARVKGMAPSFAGWDLAGKTVHTLDKLRTTPAPAPLLVTFGASWCKPCREGLPRLRALQQKHPELRLVLIDVESDAAAAQEFAQAVGVDGPALLDKFEVMAKTYGLTEGGKLTLPRTFLLDAKGRVQAIYREEGPDLEQVIEADLAALTATPAPGRDSARSADR